MRLHVGYLSHVAGTGSPAAVYRDTIELAVAAEELGLDSFWLAQHHDGALEGLLPSPLVLLAAIAERTSVIRLGTAVIAAPLEDPRRLAEDVAVLDALSGGRVELGIGAGADPVAARRFGRDHDHRHADCIAAVDGLRAVLTDSDTVPSGAGVHERMWWAASSPTTVQAATERGIGIISGRPDADLPTGSRIALARPITAGEAPAAVARRWAEDPALPLATHILAMNQPARAPAATHLATMTALATQVRPALPIPAAPR